MFSRTYFQSLIEKGSVLVNGEVIKKREKPSLGDEIEICFELPEELSVEPEDIPLAVLYEDEHIIAVNKPASMVVHPAPGHPRSTFVNALLYHCKSIEKLEEKTLRPGIVHRLDKETTGILLAAKTTDAHRALVKMFSERKIHKTYLAITLGAPKEGKLEAPLKRHPIKRQQMTVDPEGKEAISIIKVLDKTETLSLVEIELITGRTHQIRAHMKHILTPVLGDPVYGSESSNKKHHASRQYLHARKIEFIHPITQASISLTAPLPDDMQFFAKQHFKINF
jgi:23S rRNA pseudouridine1911/1915/1917 synthase